MSRILEKGNKKAEGSLARAAAVGATEQASTISIGTLVLEMCDPGTKQLTESQDVEIVK